MSKTILLLHGRHYKPPKNELKKLWLQALRHGIARDHSEKLAEFDAANIELVYYGDISNRFVSEAFSEPVPDDLADRRACLEQLMTYKRSQFSRATYRSLPGYNPWMEALADVFSGPFSFFGLSETLIEHLAPDLREYWDSYQYGSAIRIIFTNALERAMKSSSEICVVAHSMGTIVAYDVFWKLSHTSEYRSKAWNREISRWITLGSPLADATVKANLKGARLSEPDRHPTNVREWINVAAEDDFISHDQKVAGDFKAMKKHGVLQRITDKRIYNLSVRGGKSNPHHGTGYLIHPTVSNAVAEWL